MPEKIYVAYEHIHSMCKTVALKAKEVLNPDVIIAIGGGGYFPSRVMRTFLPGVQIISLAVKLYDDHTHQQGHTVRMLQWPRDIDVESHIRGKRVLIVDDVDDSRKTLLYVLKEVHDKMHPADVGVAVVLQKDKKKAGEFGGLVKSDHIFVGARVPNKWTVFPYDAQDIYEHTEKAKSTVFASKL